ncbi:hypothetical protein ACI3PL_27785, partial [Lacticaseibacillus paracasei]
MNFTVEVGCTQNEAPGFQFEIFKNTPLWPIAKIASHENESEISEILKDKSIHINYQDSIFGNTL